MPIKCSAYLSIYNDWDILPAALQSFAGYVDELVVVDGAYDWMVPHLTKLGQDPNRSVPEVYAALEASGIPFRVIARTWQNEIEKRLAGYQACTHDFIYRVDADEVFFFDDQTLEKALASDLAVGEMEMPTYLAPGWITRTTDQPTIERQCFLFDRRKVAPEIHLNYLWLVLPADTLPSAGSTPFAVYPDPLAFNAHMTGWRTPRSSVNRATFYTMNWMRKNGVPWLPEFSGRPLTNTSALFDVISPKAFLTTLRRSRIAFGMIESDASRQFVPSPLSAKQEATFTQLHIQLLDGLRETNAEAIAGEQEFLTAMPVVLDLSTPATRQDIAPDGIISVRISAPLSAATATLVTYATTIPHSEEVELSVACEGTDLRIELPPPAPSERGVVRQCVEFLVWPEDAQLEQTFRILR